MKPVRLVVLTVTLVAVVEAAVMLALRASGPLPTLPLALLDGLVVALLSAPLIYLLVIRPLGRHLAAGSVQEAADRLYGALESVADGAALVDANGVMTYVNRRLEAILGYGAGELAGQSVELLVPPAQRAAHTARRESYGASPRPRPMGRPLDLVALRKGGEEVPVQISLSPMETAEGTRTLALVTDLSELERARRAGERLERAVEQSGEIVVITDLDGTIRYVNPAFERITGYSSAEVVGRNPRILKSGRHGPQFYRRMFEALERDGEWRTHFINRRKDGSVYDQYMSISSVRDRAGRPVSYVAVGRDVTSEMEMEAQLRQAQKMDALGRLAGGVAHDFNNILTAIGGHAEMALMGGEDAREDVEEILRATRRAAALTHELLAFSRKERAETVVVDLNGVVRQAELMLRRSLGEAIALSAELTGARQPVLADAGQIEQVILNLALNARDAMPSGGSLSIRTYRASGADVPRESQDVRAATYVALDVRDTGTGIDSEVLSRIFEPFFTTKPAGKGTGLGLATAYGIVKNFEGSIAVASAPGAGTCFTVYLPLAAEDGTEPASAA